MLESKTNFPYYASFFFFFLIKSSKQINFDKSLLKLFSLLSIMSSPSSSMDHKDKVDEDEEPFARSGPRRDSGPAPNPSDGFTSKHKDVFAFEVRKDRSGHCYQGVVRHLYLFE